MIFKNCDMGSNVIFFNASQVQKVLTWSLVNAAVEEAMKAVTNSSNDKNSEDSYACQPPRTVTTCGGVGSKILFTMPGFVGNYQPYGVPPNTTSKANTLACKLVTSFEYNEQRQPKLPNILANILLFDTETGQLKCVLDGTQITAWRTAAASIVATKYLFFRRFSSNHEGCIQLAIIGCGTQGHSHALGMCATFRVSSVFLWNRTASKAERLAEELRVTAPHSRVFVASTAAEAVADADVICVGTYSAEPLVTMEMLRKGNVHINTIGAGQVHYGEIAQDIYNKGRVYVDSWASAKAELQGLKANIVSEVGNVILKGTYPPREGITIFQSMGMAAEDVTVAQAVYDQLTD